MAHCVPVRTSSLDLVVLLLKVGVSGTDKTLESDTDGSSLFASKSVVIVPPLVLSDTLYLSRPGQVVFVPCVLPWYPWEP
jgi:hypothetical protein